VDADVGHRGVRRLIAAALIAFPATAFAHRATETASSYAPWLDALLAVAAIGYGWGVTRLWRKAGAGRGIRIADVGRFVAGWTALALALSSPIDGIAEHAFAVHMLQHEMLMVVAAPLLVLSRPLEAWAWALPADTQRALAVALSASPIRRAWHRSTAPAFAWSYHAVALWAWHVPKLFVAALDDEAIHVLQHTCFFTSALVFWWAALGRRWRTPDATSIALLFTTMLHTGALGLLLTFSPTAWYAQDAPGFLGLTALEDQQLGGLVMWVPGGLAYLVAGLAIVATWLAPSGTERQRPIRSATRCRSIGDRSRG
jgi:putative membrane protein